MTKTLAYFSRGTRHVASNACSLSSISQYQRKDSHLEIIRVYYSTVSRLAWCNNLNATMISNFVINKTSLYNTYTKCTKYYHIVLLYSLLKKYKVHCQYFLEDSWWNYVLEISSPRRPSNLFSSANIVRRLYLSPRCRSSLGLNLGEIYTRSNDNWQHERVHCSARLKLLIDFRNHCNFLFRKKLFRRGLSGRGSLWEIKWARLHETPLS